MNLFTECNDKFKMKASTMKTGLKYVGKESHMVSDGIFFNSLSVFYSLAMASGKIITIVS